MRKLNRILLIRTDRIGDVVLTLPAATMLKRHFPNAQIDFLTRKYTTPLVEMYQDVDAVRYYEPEGIHRGFRGHLALANELRQYYYDAAFLFHPRVELAWVLFQAGIPIRVGTGFRWYSALFFNYKWYEHRKTGQRHELEYNLNLLQRFIPVDYQQVEFRFRIPEELEHWWATYRQEHELPERYAIVHPGSGGSAPNLTEDQYIQLIDSILKNTGLPVLLTGIPQELPKLNTLQAAFPDAPVFIPGTEFTLPQLTVIIARAALFASTSTGPLHIANAFGVPVMGFYCPAAPCSPTRWGPYGQQKWTLVPPVAPCRWCKPEKCPHGNCLAHIPGDAIQKLVKDRWAAIQK